MIRAHEGVGGFAKGGEGSAAREVWGVGEELGEGVLATVDFSESRLLEVLLVDWEVEERGH